MSNENLENSSLYSFKRPDSQEQQPEQRQKSQQQLQNLQELQQMQHCQQQQQLLETYFKPQQQQPNENSLIQMLLLQNNLVNINNDNSNSKANKDNIKQNNSNNTILMENLIKLIPTLSAASSESSSTKIFELLSNYGYMQNNNKEQQQQQQQQQLHRGDIDNKEVQGLSEIQEEDIRKFLIPNENNIQHQQHQQLFQLLFQQENLNFLQQFEKIIHQQNQRQQQQLEDKDNRQQYEVSESISLPQQSTSPNNLEYLLQLSSIMQNTNTNLCNNKNYDINKETISSDNNTIIKINNNNSENNENSTRLNTSEYNINNLNNNNNNKLEIFNQSSDNNNQNNNNIIQENKYKRKYKNIDINELDSSSDYDDNERHQKHQYENNDINIKKFKISKMNSNNINNKNNCDEDTNKEILAEQNMNNNNSNIQQNDDNNEYNIPNNEKLNIINNDDNDDDGDDISNSNDDYGSQLSEKSNFNLLINKKFNFDSSKKNFTNKNISTKMFSPILQLSDMKNDDKLLLSDELKNLTRFGSHLECSNEKCKLENLREHFHCYDAPCFGKALNKKEEIIRHIKLHKKRNESMNYGFLRYSKSENCSLRFGSHCQYNGNQTHYHCLEENCTKIYISTSDVQMHSNLHKKDSAIFKEGFRRFRATEKCKASYCMFRKERTTHYHCIRLNCKFTFKNKSDLEKHKSYHKKDLQFARDGFKKFFKNEPCSFKDCRFSSVCNHIHCLRKDCQYVCHSSGPLSSHKRKHDRMMLGTATDRGDGVCELIYQNYKILNNNDNNNIKEDDNNIELLINDERSSSNIQINSTTSSRCSSVSNFDISKIDKINSNNDDIVYDHDDDDTSKLYNLTIYKNNIKIDKLDVEDDSDKVKVKMKQKNKIIQRNLKNISSTITNNTTNTLNLNNSNKNKFISNYLNEINNIYYNNDSDSNEKHKLNIPINLSLLYENEMNSFSTIVMPKTTSTNTSTISSTITSNINTTTTTSMTNTYNTSATTSAASIGETKISEFFSIKESSLMSTKSENYNDIELLIKEYFTTNCSKQINNNNDNLIIQNTNNNDNNDCTDNDHNNSKCLKNDIIKCNYSNENDDNVNIELSEKSDINNIKKSLKHFHCLYKNCEKIIIQENINEIFQHIKEHEDLTNSNCKNNNINNNNNTPRTSSSALKLIQNQSNLMEITSIEGFFNRKRGRPPKNRVVEVYSKNKQHSPEAIFTSFKLEQKKNHENNNNQSQYYQQYRHNQNDQNNSYSTTVEATRTTNSPVSYQVQQPRFIQEQQIQQQDLQEQKILYQQYQRVYKTNETCFKFDDIDEDHIDDDKEIEKHEESKCIYDKKFHFHCDFDKKCNYITSNDYEIKQHIILQHINNNKQLFNINNNIDDNVRIDNNNDDNTNNSNKIDKTTNLNITKHLNEIKLLGDKFLITHTPSNFSQMELIDLENEKISVVRAAGTYFPISPNNLNENDNSNLAIASQHTTTTTITGEISFCEKSFCRLKKRPHKHCDWCNQAFSDTIKLQNHQIKHMSGLNANTLTTSQTNQQHQQQPEDLSIVAEKFKLTTSPGIQAKNLIKSPHKYEFSENNINSFMCSSSSSSSSAASPLQSRSSPVSPKEILIPNVHKRTPSTSSNVIEPKIPLNSTQLSSSIVLPNPILFENFGNNVQNIHLAQLLSLQQNNALYYKNFLECLPNNSGAICSVDGGSGNSDGNINNYSNINSKNFSPIDIIKTHLNNPIAAVVAAAAVAVATAASSSSNSASNSMTNFNDFNTISRNQNTANKNYKEFYLPSTTSFQASLNSIPSSNYAANFLHNLNLIPSLNLENNLELNHQSSSCITTSTTTTTTETLITSPMNSIALVSSNYNTGITTNKSTTVTTGKHHRIFKDEPIPTGYLKFRFNEDCNFKTCSYRNHQSHFHCTRNDCYYSFCDKTRFFPHTASHKRRDELMGDDFKEYHCNNLQCENNIKLAERNKSKHKFHFHCRKCDFVCYNTSVVATHRKQHNEEEFFRMAGFRKITKNEKCKINLSGGTSGVDGIDNDSMKISANSNHGTNECPYDMKQNHYHCLTCNVAVLSRQSHKHRTTMVTPSSSTSLDLKNNLVTKLVDNSINNTISGSSSCINSENVNHDKSTVFY